MDLLDLLPLLLKSGPAVQAGLQGVDLKNQKNIAGEISQIAQAQTNTSNPLFQSLLTQNKQAGQQNLAATIAQLQSQNRIAQSNGQKPLLDQERGGESIFRNLVQGQQDVGNQAIGQTFDQLKGAQNSLGGAYNTQNNLSTQEFANTQKKVGAYGNLSDAITGLFGLKNTNQPTTSQNINWNQPQSYQMPPNNNYGPMQLLPQNNGYIANG